MHQDWNTRTSVRSFPPIQTPQSSSNRAHSVLAQNFNHIGWMFKIIPVIGWKHKLCFKPPTIYIYIIYTTYICHHELILGLLCMVFWSHLPASSRMDERAKAMSSKERSKAPTYQKMEAFQAAANRLLYLVWYRSLWTFMNIYVMMFVGLFFSGTWWLVNIKPCFNSIFPCHTAYTDQQETLQSVSHGAHQQAPSISIKYAPVVDLSVVSENVQKHSKTNIGDSNSNEMQCITGSHHIQTTHFVRPLRDLVPAYKKCVRKFAQTRCLANDSTPKICFEWWVFVSTRHSFDSRSFQVNPVHLLQLFVEAPMSQHVLKHPGGQKSVEGKLCINVAWRKTGDMRIRSDAGWLNFNLSFFRDEHPANCLYLTAVYSTKQKDYRVQVPHYFSSQVFQCFFISVPQQNPPILGRPGTRNGCKIIAFNPENQLVAASTSYETHRKRWQLIVSNQDFSRGSSKLFRWGPKMITVAASALVRPSLESPFTPRTGEPPWHLPCEKLRSSSTMPNASELQQRNGIKSTNLNCSQFLHLLSWESIRGVHKSKAT